MDKIIQIAVSAPTEETPQSIHSYYPILFALTESGRVFWKTFANNGEWEEVDLPPPLAAARKRA